MMLYEATHHIRRALFEIESASAAIDDGIGRVHAQLSDLHLEHARLLVGRETGTHLADNVVPLRATA